MPAKQAPAKRVTNHDLFVLIDGTVLPEVQEVKGILIEAGLANGHAKDVRLFFDQRAKDAAAKAWLADKIRPIARLKVLVAIVGFVSTAAWAFLALRQVASTVHLPH